MCTKPHETKEKKIDWQKFHRENGETAYNILIFMSEPYCQEYPLKAEYEFYYDSYVIGRNRYPLSERQKRQFRVMRYAVECLARWEKPPDYSERAWSKKEDESTEEEMNDGMMAYEILSFLADSKFGDNRYIEEFWVYAKTFRRKFNVSDENEEHLSSMPVMIECIAAWEKPQKKNKKHNDV